MGELEISDKLIWAIECDSEKIFEEIVQKLNRKDCYKAITVKHFRILGVNKEEYSVCSVLVDKGYEKFLIKFIDLFGTAFMEETYRTCDRWGREIDTLYQRCVSKKLDNVVSCYCYKKIQELETSKTKGSKKISNKKVKE